VREVLREAIDVGEPVSTAAVARRLGIHYSTAIRHVRAAREAGVLEAE
jgi:transposase